LWHLCGRRYLERYQQRCERVAYMLWVMAQLIPDEAPAEPVRKRRRRRSAETPTGADTEPAPDE
jgi:hypothetical protein